MRRNFANHQLEPQLLAPLSRCCLVDQHWLSTGHLPRPTIHIRISRRTSRSLLFRVTDNQKFARVKFFLLILLLQKLSLSSISSPNPTKTNNQDDLHQISMPLRSHSSSSHHTSRTFHTPHERPHSLDSSNFSASIPTTPAAMFSPHLLSCLRYRTSHKSQIVLRCHGHSFSERRHSYIIIIYVNETLCEDIPHSVKALDGKYKLVKDELDGDGKTTLQLLKYYHDDLGLFRRVERARMVDADLYGVCG